MVRKVRGLKQRGRPREVAFLGFLSVSLLALAALAIIAGRLGVTQGVALSSSGHIANASIVQDSQLAPLEGPREIELRAQSPSPTATPQVEASRPITVVLDPGHGGTADPGAMHRNPAGEVDLKEKEANLSIALCLAELLRQEGIAVILTRDSDRAVNDPPQDLNGDGQITDRDDLQARVDIANAAGAHLFISIHNNGFGDAKEGGTEVWWSPDRPFADDNAFLAAHTQTALLKRLSEAGYRSQDRGLKVDRSFQARSGEPPHLFVLGPAENEQERPNGVPGILGETLFVTNDTEAELLTRPAIIEAIAKGYMDGILAYLRKE